MIVKIGDLSGYSAARIINAEGKIVNYLSQGVTTVVTGNCGYGLLNIAEIAELWNEQGIGTNAVQLAGFGTIRRHLLQPYAQ